MAQRNIRKMERGVSTVDGAGVHLVRVLGRDTARDFDPFLMLDSFDSTNPEDYIKGFPLHPHRGIETITYLIDGTIEHADSLGNKGTIRSGQSQWMTAGSGILHQEMPKPHPHMLGLQLWLNLPSDEKMTAPKYFDINEDMVGVAHENGATVRVISGDYKNTKGVKPPHIPATLYDVSLEPEHKITLDTKSDETVFVFLIKGDGIVAGKPIAEKTAVLLGDGDEVTLEATNNSEMRFIFGMAKPLGESIAWGGPIVMNTRKELDQAFSELEQGTFIK